VQSAANRDPADARDGERDFAGDDDVPLRQRPKFTLVIAAGQVRAPGVAGVAVADGERLFGDLLRASGGSV
jgi:hypothetical protein